jgi:Flp pilus assembly protein TadD
MTAGAQITSENRHGHSLLLFQSVVWVFPLCDDVRYAYVHAVGLHSASRCDEALAVLRAADARQPYNLGILGALVSMDREAGNIKAALAYARKAAEAAPEDPEVKRLVIGLEDTE